MGIKAHKRKILICKTVRAVTETVGVIGMAATWIGVSHMANSSPALLPGATRIVSISLGITESDDTMTEKLKELTDSLSEAQRINDGLRNRIKEETDKQQELEKQLSQPENTDETIKVAAERDIYKDLYMKLTEKLIGDKI